MLPGISMAVAGLMASATSVPVNPVSLETESVSKTALDANATSSFTFRTDRTVQNQDGQTIDPEWLATGYSPTDYQILVTVISGTTPSGTIGSWISLSSNRTWSLTRTTTGTSSCSLKVEIRDAASPNTVRGSAIYTMTSERQETVVVDWSNIFGFSSISSTVSEENSDQIMTSTGTLNISYSGSGIQYAVIKNGSSLGQVSSVSVANGDTIRFFAGANGLFNGETRNGTITVSGLHSDSISVSLTYSNL